MRRELFEATVKDLDLSKWEDGTYDNPFVQIRWEGFMDGWEALNGENDRLTTEVSRLTAIVDKMTGEYLRLCVDEKGKIDAIRAENKSLLEQLNGLQGAE